MPRYARVLLLILTYLALFLGAAAWARADDAPTLSPKGIYYDVDRYQKTGIKFYVDLDEGGKSRRVPASHPFHSGDRFTFTFEINRNTHIYVVNRTEVREVRPVATGYHAKRIHRTRYVPDGELSEPRLLFPTSRAGSNNRLASGTPHKIPHKGVFKMDEESGTEKLYVVISDQRLGLDEFFDPETGKVRQRGGGPDAGRPDPGAILRLEDRFRQWKRNAAVEDVDVELVTKGIVLEVDSYAVAVDPSMPAMVEIDLKHYR